MKLVREKEMTALPITVVRGKVIKVGAYPTRMKLRTALNEQQSDSVYLFLWQGRRGQNQHGCTYAVRSDEGKRTLIVTTDPASNVSRCIRTSDWTSSHIHCDVPNYLPWN